MDSSDPPPTKWTGPMNYGVESNGAFPDVEVPEFALPEGDVVHGVCQQLQQDAGCQPARPSPEDRPEHPHHQVPALPAQALLLSTGLLDCLAGLDGSQDDHQGEGGEKYLDPATIIHMYK